MFTYKLHTNSAASSPKRVVGNILGQATTKLVQADLDRGDSGLAD